MMMNKLVTFLAFFPAAVLGGWPKEFDVKKDLQPGFEMGLAPELQGLWVGDEKFLEEDGIIHNYCTRAFFHVDGHMTWESVPDSTCEAAEARPKSKRVSGNWFEKIQAPGYIYRFRQKQCLPADVCTEDITTTSDRDDPDQFNTWEVEAKACGAHLKDDLIANNTYVCESYQTNLISQIGADGIKEYLVVAVLSYRFYEDGFDQYQCPDKPSFLKENFKQTWDGSARFVLQTSLTGSFDSTNPCNWDCFNGNDMYDCGGNSSAVSKTNELMDEGGGRMRGSLWDSAP